MSKRYWFEESEKYIDIINHLGITRDEYLSLTEKIKQVFPKTWIEEECPKYPKGQSFFNLWPVSLTRLPFNPIP